MKKLSSLMLTGLLALGLNACTNEGTSLEIRGVLPPGESAGADVHITAGSYDPDYSENLPMSLNGYNMQLDLHNNMTEETGWNEGESGGGGGSSFNPTIVAQNTVYLESIHFTCKSIDGDPDRCKGMKSVKKSVTNYPISAGQDLSLPVRFGDNEAMDWGGFEEEIQLEFYLTYHDSGVMSGKSSHSTFTIYKSYGSWARLMAFLCPKGGKFTIQEGYTEGQDFGAEWDECEEPEEE